MYPIVKKIGRSVLHEASSVKPLRNILNKVLIGGAHEYRERVYLQLAGNRSEDSSSIQSLINNGIVLHGPFKDMVYPPDISTSAVSTRILGTYENEIHDAMEAAISRNPDVVIDVGCAEGYYAVGMAKRLPETQVLAYDILEFQRNCCSELAKRNGVLEQVEVLGECTPDELLKSVSQAERPLIICDCEGYEAVLFAELNVPGLAKADIIVELHEYVDIEIPLAITRRFASTHDCALMQSTDDFANRLSTRPLKSRDCQWEPIPPAVRAT